MQQINQDVKIRVSLSLLEANIIIALLRSSDDMAALELMIRIGKLAAKVASGVTKPAYVTTQQLAGRPMLASNTLNGICNEQASPRMPNASTSKSDADVFYEGGLASCRLLIARGTAIAELPVDIKWIYLQSLADAGKYDATQALQAYDEYQTFLFYVEHPAEMPADYQHRDYLLSIMQPCLDATGTSPSTGTNASTNIS
jgi:hypothetical protein